MNREQGERMLALADYLESVPEANFDMGAWHITWQGAARVYQGPECGTVACAMGHACDMPLFQDLGLRLTRTLVTDRETYADVGIEGRDDVRDGYEAAEVLFGITDAQSQDLFSTFYEYEDVWSDEVEGDNSPKGVAGRLREFVKEHAT